MIEIELRVDIESLPVYQHAAYGSRALNKLSPPGCSRERPSHQHHSLEVWSRDYRNLSSLRSSARLTGCLRCFILTVASFFKIYKIYKKGMVCDKVSHILEPSIDFLSKGHLLYMYYCITKVSYV